MQVVRANDWIDQICDKAHKLDLETYEAVIQARSILKKKLEPLEPLDDIPDEFVDLLDRLNQAVERTQPDVQEIKKESLALTAKIEFWKPPQKGLN